MSCHQESSPRARAARVVALGACFVLAMMLPTARAVVTISTGDVLTGNHGTNLIANGSFETGNSGVNLGWTPGSHIGGYPGSEVGSIPSWTSSYPAGAYGWWGPLGFTGAGPADGLNMVYFGNAFNSVGTTATFTDGVLLDTVAPQVTGFTIESGKATVKNILTDLRGPMATPPAPAPRAPELRREPAVKPS